MVESGGKITPMAKEKDISLKHFLEKEDIFCELFNRNVFRDGRIQLRTLEMFSVDTKESVKLKGTDSNIKFLERYRDVVKCGITNVGKVLLGVENQSRIERLMPSRILIYDCLYYEYLFRNRKELYPCVTIILYTGKRKWKNPKSFYDMLGLDEETRICFRDILPVYQIFVIDALHIPQEEIDTYQTDLRFFFTALQAANKRETEPDDKLTAKYVETYDALAALTGDKRFQVEKGGISMCVLFDMAEERGKKKGEERGEQRVNRLIQILMEKNRFDDIQRSIWDSEYQKKLFAEFQLQ